MVKKVAYGSASQPILDLKTSDGSMETSDYKKVQILHEYFSTVGEKLASDLSVCRQVNNKTYINQGRCNVLRFLAINDDISKR